MRNTFITVGAVILGTLSYSLMASADYQIEWATSAGGETDDEISDVAVHPDGSIVIWGKTQRDFDWSPFTLGGDGPRSFAVRLVDDAPTWLVSLTGLTPIVQFSVAPALDGNTWVALNPHARVGFRFGEFVLPMPEEIGRGWVGQISSAGVPRFVRERPSAVWVYEQLVSDANGVAYYHHGDRGIIALGPADGSVLFDQAFEVAAVSGASNGIVYMEYGNDDIILPGDVEHFGRMRPPDGTPSEFAREEQFGFTWRLALAADTLFKSYQVERIGSYRRESGGVRHWVGARSASYDRSWWRREIAAGDTVSVALELAPQLESSVAVVGHIWENGHIGSINLPLDDPLDGERNFHSYLVLVSPTGVGEPLILSGRSAVVSELRRLDAEHVLLAGTFWGTVTLGETTLTARGGSDVWVARAALGPPAPDRFETDPVPVRFTHTTHWGCSSSAGAPCTSIFENQAPTVNSAEDVFEAVVADLTLHDETDVDRIEFTLPDPKLRTHGDFHEDVRASDSRGTGSTVPLPDCHRLTRRSLGKPRPDSEAVHVQTRLIVRVRSSGARPLRLEGEQLRVHAAGVDITDRFMGGPTELTMTCPRTPQPNRRDPDAPREPPLPATADSIEVVLGERGSPRPAEGLGGYTLEAEYRIDVERSLPGWLDELELPGVLARLRCLDGRLFPECTGGGLGFGLRESGFEFYHPSVPFPDCIADGPGCFGLHLLDWHGAGDLQLELVSTSPETKVTLLDMDQRVVAEVSAGAPPFEPQVPPNFATGINPRPGASAQVGLASVPKTVLMGPEKGAPHGHLMTLTANPEPGTYVLRISGPRARIQGRLLAGGSPSINQPTRINAGLSLTHVALIVLAGVLIVAGGVMVAQREV